MTKPITDPLETEVTKESPAKDKNYTKVQTELLESVYPKNPCRETVNDLAAKMGKSPRSVIAKLSNMKIYVTPKRTTKSGTPIVKKETLVTNITTLLEIDAPTLVKANKADLEKLLSAVEEWTGSIEDEAELLA